MGVLGTVRRGLDGSWSGQNEGLRFDREEGHENVTVCCIASTITSMTLLSFFSFYHPIVIGGVSFPYYYLGLAVLFIIRARDDLDPLFASG